MNQSSDKEQILKGFAPLIRFDSTTLILGSMPGAQSLAEHQYYAHPRNRFWHVMVNLLNNGIPLPDYTERCRLLLDHHIALWDVISTCKRTGSLDTAIREEVPNDFVRLFETYPQIRQVLFNGAKAHTAFKRYAKTHALPAEIHYLPLPSTSPANAAYSLEKLTKLWGTPLNAAHECS